MLVSTRRRPIEVRVHQAEWSSLREICDWFKRKEMIWTCSSKATSQNNYTIQGHLKILYIRRAYAFI